MLKIVRYTKSELTSANIKGENHARAQTSINSSLWEYAFVDFLQMLFIWDTHAYSNINTNALDS